MATKKQPAHFEKSLAELEALVDAMESGDLSLEDALKSFEQGVKLTQQCQQALRAAEQKVTLLTQAASTPEETPFQEAESD